jgi:hypothetical protein
MHLQQLFRAERSSRIEYISSLFKLKVTSACSVLAGGMGRGQYRQ